MKRIILAFQLLTRLPLKKDVGADARMLAESAAFYPLCGAFVGLMAALAYILVMALTFGLQGAARPACAVFAAAAMFLSTGGLHLDGLSDSADGLLSARTPERMLEIMKDSRMGAMGAIALIFDIAARIALLAPMKPLLAALTLVCAPCAAKVGVAAAAWASPYARQSGLGKSVTENARFTTVLAAWALASVLCAALGIFGGILPFLLSPLLALIIGVILSRKVAKVLGGVTGDILGAVNEITEISLMLFILAAHSLFGDLLGG